MQPLGGSIADIALDEPLRKYNNDVADAIEFPSGTEGKALVTRNIAYFKGLGGLTVSANSTNQEGVYRWNINGLSIAGQNTGTNEVGNIASTRYNAQSNGGTYICREGVAIINASLRIFDLEYTGGDDKDALIAANANTEFIYQRATPTTELVDAPQIQEANSYSCVISQGAKAIEWSSFTVNPE